MTSKRDLQDLVLDLRNANKLRPEHVRDVMHEINEGFIHQTVQVTARARALAIGDLSKNLRQAGSGIHRAMENYAKGEKQ